MSGRYPRLDPEHSRSVLFATKLSVPDAARLERLAAKAGVGKSEYIRTVLLDAIEDAAELEAAG